MNAFKIIVDGDISKNIFVDKYMSTGCTNMTSICTIFNIITLNTYLGPIQLNIVNLVGGDLLYKYDMYKDADAYIFFADLSNDQSIEYAEINSSDILAYEKPIIIRGSIPNDSYDNALMDMIEKWRRKNIDVSLYTEGVMDDVDIIMQCLVGKIIGTTQYIPKIVTAPPMGSYNTIYKGRETMCMSYDTKSLCYHKLSINDHMLTLHY